LACAICETRKEKRFCPAVHGRICAICCGTEREVTIDCPGDCPYLRQAREHERPREMDEIEPAALFPQIELNRELVSNREPLLAGLSYGMAQAAHADRTLRDNDLIAALTTLAKTYETMVSSGLVYEPPTANPVQQAVIAELQKMVASYREIEKKQIGFSRLPDSELLQVFVFLLRLALARTNGRPRSRAFIDFLEAQFPQKGDIIATTPEQASRLIVP
jgi:hypothetical protein